MKGSTSSQSKSETTHRKNKNHKKGHQQSHKNGNHKRLPRQDLSPRSHKKNNRHNEKDFSFNKNEIERLVSGLLRQHPALTTELRQLCERIDSRETVMIDSVGDKTLKKKLRHLFHAFHLKEMEIGECKGYKKAKHCSKSITKVYDHFADKIGHNANNKRVDIVGSSSEQEQGCPSIVFVEETSQENFESSNPVSNESEVAGGPGKAVAKGPTMPTLKDVEDFEEICIKQQNEEQAIFNIEDEKVKYNDLHSERKRENWMTEAPAILRGLFKDLNKQESKPIDRFKERIKAEETRKLKEMMQEYNKTMRPKSLLELHQEGTFQNDVKKQKEYIASHQLLRDTKYTKQKHQKKDSGDSPWRTFDRERDLDIKRKVEAEDFHRLLDRSKQLSDRFGESQFQSSFL